MAKNMNSTINKIKLYYVFSLFIFLNYSLIPNDGSSEVMLLVRIQTP